MKKKKRYCSECGREMLLEHETAGYIYIIRYFGMDLVKFRLDSKFDTETGKMNIAEIYTCPKYKKKLFGDNGHDRYCVYKDEYKGKFGLN